MTQRLYDESGDVMTISTIPELDFRTIGGVRIRCAESGGAAQPTVLLTSPWPASLYSFAGCGTPWPSTPGSWPSTCPGSGV